MRRAPRRVCRRPLFPVSVWIRLRLAWARRPIPDSLVKVIDSRRFAATVDVDGEHLNVAYTDSDDLAMFVLEHPGATIVSPQEAVDAYHRRLHAASRFTLADESASPVSASVVSPSISRDVREPGDPESIKAQNKKNGPAFQTGSEVDRRLRLMLFLSAHLGEEFSMSELAERFIGKPKNDDELKKFVNIIHKDINTLTTVSDDGEMAGSQFFDIDWSLLDAEGIVSATNSLGLERLAGISQQYLSMLTASVSYLAHSSLLPDKLREQAESLYSRLRQHVKPGDMPWLSLTGYEMEPRNFSIVKSAISKGMLLDMEYTDGAGRIQRKLVAPDKIFVDEGVYYVAVWTDVSNAAPADKMKFVKTDTTINKATGNASYLAGASHPPASSMRSWSEPTRKSGHSGRARIRTAQVEFRQWHTCRVHNQSGRPVVHRQPVGSHRREMRRRREGASDCVFRFLVCRVLHRARRHITAVAPETLRTMIIARAQHELSVGDRENED